MAEDLSLKNLKVGDFVEITGDLVRGYVTGSVDPGKNSQYDLRAKEPELHKYKNIFKINKACQVAPTGKVNYWPEVEIEYKRKSESNYYLLHAGLAFKENDGITSSWDYIKIRKIPEEECYKLGLKIKPIEPVVSFEFNYSGNRTFWNDKLEKDMIQKALEKANSKVRMTLRAWPFGKVLGYEVKKEEDKINFYWKDNRATAP